MPNVEPDSITCPRCGRTSYHRDDITEKYCGFCHQWHAFMVVPERPEVSDELRDITVAILDGKEIPDSSDSLVVRNLVWAIKHPGKFSGGYEWTFGSVVSQNFCEEMEAYHNTGWEVVSVTASFTAVGVFMVVAKRPKVAAQPG